MKLFLFAVALALASATIAASYTEYCQLKSSRTEGLNKICFYSCPSGTYATTIKNVELRQIGISVTRK